MIDAYSTRENVRFSDILEALRAMRNAPDVWVVLETDVVRVPVPAMAIGRTLT